MSVPIRVLLLAVLLLAAGCTTTGGRPSSSDKDPNAADRVLALYRIDIDPRAVKGGAPLLFDEPPPQNAFGLVRRAQGFFSVSDSGFVRIEVKVAEPVVSVDGRRSEQVYTILKFFGRASDDEERATTMSGEEVNVPSSMQADEVHFSERGPDKISIQAYQGGKPSAYVMHFHRAAVPRRDVPVPWKTGAR